jgi:hypothetical protein
VTAERYDCPGWTSNTSGPTSGSTKSGPDKDDPVRYRVINVQHGLTADVGSIDFWSCTTCQHAYLGKISLIDKVKRQGLGTWLLEQLRIDTSGYSWSTPAQAPRFQRFLATHPAHSPRRVQRERRQDLHTHQGRPLTPRPWSRSVVTLCWAGELPRWAASRRQSWLPQGVR